MKNLQYAYVILLLTGCASMLMSEPTKVDPVEAKYIEAENQIQGGHAVLSELGTRELLARANGAKPGTVITKQTYDRIWMTLDEAKHFLRQAHVMTKTPGSCVQASTYKSLGLSGCFSREQAAVVALAVISKLNEEMK